jgi:type IV secretion system protein VirB9
MRLLIAATFALGSVALAQPTLPPIQPKRLPPEKGKANAKAYIDQYDFGGQLLALQEPTTAPATTAPNPPAAPTRQQPTGVPPGFRPKSDVHLTETAEQAVRMNDQWMSSHNEPAAGRDGRVLYSFGAGLATVVCAPLRICMIELQAGEKLVGEPHIGDSVRWNLAPALYGSGPDATSVIVLKPQNAGLDTNLLITTDRRAYYLRLLSKPEEYVAKVAFAYPEDDQAERKWKEHIEQQREEQRQATRIAEMPANAIDSLNFGYGTKGGPESLRPIRVFDDGKKTYIQMNPAVKNRETPALVVVGADGKQEMVNYRVKNDLYIVDRLFDRAALILGTGKKAQKVEVRRERKS